VPAGTTRVVIQRAQSGDIEVVVLSPTGSLVQGHNDFTVEFRSRTGELVAVEGVKAGTNMVMPGMVMPAGLELTPTTTPGRFAASADFGMAGVWQWRVEWTGPAPGAVSFEGAVQ
jgi:hypothetical protein